MSRNHLSIPSKLLTWLPLSAVATATACSPNLAPPAAVPTPQRVAAAELSAPAAVVPASFQPAAPTPLLAAPKEQPNSAPAIAAAAATTKLRCSVGNSKSVNYRNCDEAADK